MNQFDICHTIDVVASQCWGIGVFYDVYLDESGDDGDFPIQVVGGYLVTPSGAKELERKWRRSLKKHNLEYFHMVEVCHGSGICKNISIEKRIEIQKDFFKIINDHIEISIGCAVPLEKYRQGDHGEPYEFCAYNCFLAVYDLALSRHNNIYHGRGDFGVSAFYESGHKNAAKLSNIINSLEPSKRPRSFGFVKKADSGMIQAADVIVYQYRKFIKDQVERARKPRADFKFLMQKPGAFWNIVVNDAMNVYVFWNGSVKCDKEIDNLRAIFGSEKIACPELQAIID